MAVPQRSFATLTRCAARARFPRDLTKLERREETMSSTAACPAVRPDLQYSLSEGSAVVLDLAAGEYVALDGVATTIWRTLVGDRNLDAAVEAILEEYEVEEPRLRADVADFLDECRARGWLVQPEV
jgi:hypothetical protein